jgi:hypothetical protein
MRQSLQHSGQVIHAGRSQPSAASKQSPEPGRDLEAGPTGSWRASVQRGTYRRPRQQPAAKRARHRAGRRIRYSMQLLGLRPAPDEFTPPPPKRQCCRCPLLIRVCCLVVGPKHLLQWQPAPLAIEPPNGLIARFSGPRTAPCEIRPPTSLFQPLSVELSAPRRRLSALRQRLVPQAPLEPRPEKAGLQ